MKKNAPVPGREQDQRMTASSMEEFRAALLRALTRDDDVKKIRDLAVEGNAHLA